jgi:hypothetical protein
MTGKVLQQHPLRPQVAHHSQVMRQNPERAPEYQPVKSREHADDIGGVLV